MPGLIGKKVGMISVFGADGKNVPCTVVEAGPCVVTQVRTVETDGYSAIQLAYDEKKEKQTSKALKGHFEKAGTTPKKKVVEFEADFAGDPKLGDVLTVADVFTEDVKFVDVVGTSKGKGFQGVVKRLAGHMGNERVKVFNLEVLKVIPENNLIVVKGSVPGAKGSYLIVEA